MALGGLGAVSWLLTRDLMAQQAGQRLSRRRKALEEVGAGTARAVTNANTQAGLSPGAQLAPLQRHFSPGNALEMSGFAGIKFPGVEPRALFWVLFWVLGLVLGSVLCSLSWLSSFVVLLSCSLPARGSPEQPWNSSWSGEVLPGLLGLPSWDSNPTVTLFSLPGISWVVFSSSFQRAGLSSQAKPGSAPQDPRIRAQHSGM